MGLSLESMAIEIPAVAGHPNRAEFRGVLTTVDAASDRSPSGARGHRVLLTRRAAETAIPSLLGMALDYSPLLDRHDARRKIGVITRAEIVGRTIEVGGFLYARDFPEIVAEIAKPASLSARRSARAKHRRAWHVVRNRRRARRRHQGQRVGLKSCDVHGRGGAAAGQGRLQLDVDRIAVSQTNQLGGRRMNEEMVQQMTAAAERLAAATEALDRVLGKLDAQQEMLNAKVDRIVAAVEENVARKERSGSAKTILEANCGSGSWSSRSRTRT